MEKNYEIIVYGATGFTGKICCKYLRDKYADLKWGIAGAGRRSASRDSGGPFGPHTDRKSGDIGGRHRSGLHPTFRSPPRIRRAPRRIPGDQKRTCAQAARTTCRRLPRCGGPTRLPAGLRRLAAAAVVWAASFVLAVAVP